jgi:hypothetical protein
MKFRPMGAELFHTDGRRDSNDKADSHFSKFSNAPKNARVDMWVLNGSDLIETSVADLRFTFCWLFNSVVIVVLRNISPYGRWP